MEKKKITQSIFLSWINRYVFNPLDNQIVNHIYTSEVCKDKIYSVDDPNADANIIIMLNLDSTFKVDHIGYSPAKHFNIQNWLDNVLDEIVIKVVRNY